MGTIFEPKLLSTDSPGQNIWPKVKIKQNRNKSRARTENSNTSVFCKFWLLLQKIHFCTGDWGQTVFPSNFEILLMFPNFLTSCTLRFLEGNSYTKFIILDIKFCFPVDGTFTETQ